MFNPQTRWDRSLPGDSRQNNEAVEVIARFFKSRISPLCFFLKEKRCDIAQINYSWTERKGNAVIYYFSVSDKSDNYCLFLNAETMSWRLLTE
jgi:hypothetical protein